MRSSSCFQRCLGRPGKLVDVDDGDDDGDHGHGGDGWWRRPFGGATAQSEGQAPHYVTVCYCCNNMNLVATLHQFLRY